MTHDNPLANKEVLADVTRVQAGIRPDEIAMVFEGQLTTFAQLDERASQIANGIIAEGVQPETRLAILDKNSDSFFELMFGSS
ncbi:MAG: AMP-binding protein, partial [Chloroflexota bacterium]